MTKKEFKIKLLEVGLNQASFAREAKLHYVTVAKWKDGTVPEWVKLWIEGYKAVQKENKNENS